MPAPPTHSVFLTGATGFIGSVVLERLLACGVESIVCLTTRPNLLQPLMKKHAGLRCVCADLNDAPAYADALAGVDTVVHMAAATGSSSEAELNRVNVDGTQHLLEACRAKGVRRFLYMSSIAAGYDDLSVYPYGRTKREAEQLVRESGLDYTILRPTIVLGERSPAFAMLRKIACLPAIPILGGGKTKVQPVNVADVARTVELIVNDRRFGGSLVELGGPEVLSFADFLQRIRRACGRRRAAFVPIPVWPLRAVLALAQRIFGESFPVSPGQLSPFMNDGTAEPNPVHEQLRPSMMPLDALLRAIAAPPDVSPVRADLARESRVIGRYLAGRDVDPYVERKFIDGHAVVLRGAAPIQPIDRLLLRFAVRGPWRMRIADAYARIFRPHGLLRRKLVFMLAILENSRTHHRDFTSGGGGNAWAAALRITGSVMVFGVALLVGIVAFAPRHLLVRTTDGDAWP